MTFVTVDPLKKPSPRRSPVSLTATRQIAAASPTEIDDGDACDTDLMPLAC
jgi:hypothetical protein